VARVVWSASAVRDMARLQAFLDDKNSEAARRLAGPVLRSIGTLATHPQIGRPVAHLGPGVPERIIPFGGSSYIARYVFDGVIVSILSVRHAREAGY
jgi:plasmid stabilization system protein ParE